MEDRFFKTSVINRHGRSNKVFSALLKKGGYAEEYRSLLFCPFHDNYNTPACKYYMDDSSESIYCFSEGKSYRLSDYYEKILGLNLDMVFDRIWESLSEEEKATYKDLYGEYSYQVEVANLADYGKFRIGAINYSELLDKISENW